MPTDPSEINVPVTVAIPTVISKISTPASAVRFLAVDAVPATSPVIPPTKLDAATLVAVRTPTIISGTPVNPCAVDAVPTSVPSTVKSVIVATPTSAPVASSTVVVTIPSD